jgi:membrane protease YdiL (CAAX protease family)
MPAQRFAIWFVVAMLPMVASQLIRLQQSEPALWLACDYAGRLSMIAVLAAIPTARQVAFKREQAIFDAGQIAIWIILLVLAEIFLIQLIQAFLTYSFPPWRLGFYPYLQGGLYWFDLTFGLMLVAYSEELLFRRCARFVFGALLGDGWPMMIATSIFFGAYHWWSGIWNAAGAGVAGLFFMIFYKRAGVLWPVVVLHYIIDLVLFK